MSKPMLSPQEFVARLNEELPRHYGYRNGLQVFLTPETGIPTGYDWEPKDPDTMAAVAAASAALTERFDVNLAPLSRGGVTIGGG